MFAGMPEVYDFILDNIEPRQFQADQFIVKEGQKATHMYILEQGNCEVLVKGSLTKKEQFVRDLGPGSIFGELALLHGNRRTASVRSKDLCTVGCLNEETFNQLIKNFPEVKNRFKEYMSLFEFHVLLLLVINFPRDMVKRELYLKNGLQ